MINSQEEEKEDTNDENNNDNNCGVDTDVKADRKVSSTPAHVDEALLDWNDLLSPEFQEQKIPPKRRAGDSLLLLPTPSPMEEDFEDDDIDETKKISVWLLSVVGRRKTSRRSID